MTDLHVDVFAEGTPAIFVHGSFGWGLDTFPAVVALLAAGLRPHRVRSLVVIEPPVYGLEGGCTRSLEAIRHGARGRRT